MILHNILIIGLTWLITTMVLGIICFIIGVIIGVTSSETFDVECWFEEYSEDCRGMLKWYYKMPVSIRLLLLPIRLIVESGVGLYYIFN